MSYAVVQTRRFARAYKKLHDKVAGAVDTAVAMLAADPGLAEVIRCIRHQGMLDVGAELG